MEPVVLNFKKVEIEYNGRRAIVSGTLVDGQFKRMDVWISNLDMYKLLYGDDAVRAEFDAIVLAKVKGQKNE